MSKPKSSHLRRQKAKAAKAKAAAPVATPETSAREEVAVEEVQQPSDIKSTKSEAAENGAEYDFDGDLANGAGTDDSLLELYKDVMTRFEQTAGDASISQQDEKPEVLWNDDDEIGEEDEEEGAQPKISKKKRKELSKLSVAELKALVKKPEVVEWTDTSSSDPRLLVHIKSYRNVVPVPTHWSLKREYLSSRTRIFAGTRTHVHKVV